jgi:cell wall-associated NlpC family hydrolase
VRLVDNTTPLPAAPGQPFPQEPGHDPHVPVPGPKPGDPAYPDGAHPTLSGDPAHDVPPMHVHTDASDTIRLADNPPHYDQTLGPGAQRDQNWRDYLNGTNADGSHRPYGQLPEALPNPDAVSDPALRTVGAAARQQGVSYAWGGNQSATGPSAGHKATPGEYPKLTPEQLHRDGSWLFNDDNRTGFDCGGLARFSVNEGYGTDIHAGTATQFGNLGGVPQSVANPQPGDLAYWGPGGANHVAINLGNGVVIEALQSGEPVEVLSLNATNAMEGAAPIWMRPH